jgi:hypothetical protein
MKITILEEIEGQPSYQIHIGGMNGPMLSYIMALLRHRGSQAVSLSELLISETVLTALAESIVRAPVSAQQAIATREDW